MTKDEMATLLRSVGSNENTIMAMCNAFDMGVDYEREACAALIESYGTWENTEVICKAIRARGEE
jgi:hypothetical protein